MSKVSLLYRNLLIENDEYEIEDYVNKMAKIIERKLDIYSNLNGKL